MAAAMMRSPARPLPDLCSSVQLPASPNAYNASSPQSMAASTRAIPPAHGSFLSASAVAPAVVPHTPTSISPAVNSLEAKDAGLLNPGPSSRNQTLSPKPQRHALSPSLTPQPPSLTTPAPAAKDGDRKYRDSLVEGQTTPHSLLRDRTMTSSSDAPPAATTKVSEPLAKITKNLTIPESAPNDGTLQTSPVSMSSFGSVDQTTAPTATALENITAGPIISEPASTSDSSMQQQSTPQQQTQPQQQQQQQQQQQSGHGAGSSLSNNDTPSNRSFTYPPPMASPDDLRQGPQRNMSLPMSGYAQGSPRSPAQKRHKCPYCSTDFTRHHNLKSHLLTHSQEKPYECPTCQARFRRLHDLKRHSKLHTGERPHMCNKCGRKFARGDALARHNKGQGGCAGRRASFADDDKDGMDGIEYNDGDRSDPDRMDEDDGPEEDQRRRSEPSSHAHHSARQGSISGGPYGQHPNSYPPLGVMGPGGRQMYPPQQQSSVGSTTTGTTSSRDQSLNMSSDGGRSISSVHFPPHQQGIIPQNNIIESPKPISPGHPDPQHRSGLSENLPANRQAHQQPYSRGSGTSAVGLPPPVISAGGAQLPPIAPMTQADPRGPTSRGSQSSGRVPIQPAPGPAQAPNMIAQQASAPDNSPHAANQSPSANGQNPNLNPWEYIRQLEARLSGMHSDYERRIRSLEDELTSLKGHPHQRRHQPQQEPAQQHPVQPQQHQPPPHQPQPHQQQPHQPQPPQQPQQAQQPQQQPLQQQPQPPQQQQQPQHRQPPPPQAQLPPQPIAAQAEQGR